MRVGIGYDVHRLVPSRKLVLGGVEVPHELGLLGHSDADVLLHAIMDAILGAASLGDIGRLFPDTDDRYKGISSMLLLEEVYRRIDGLGYSIGNIDAVVICERPKLKDYIQEMEENIARVLKTDVHNINIKATTTEKLGFTGRKEGIASEAIVLLK